MILEDEELYRELIRRLGEDPEREGLLKTPSRAMEALRFMTQGYSESIEEVFNGAIFESDYNDLVLVRDIEFYSLCEHHLLPFFGVAHVAYVPNGRIVGLSKVARLVNMFARRLQVQERMTQQIAEAMQNAVSPRGVAVLVEAQHLCMMIRGVQKQNSRMITSHISGCFREDPQRMTELMDILKASDRPTV
ncbi:MAG: GTP cyclohydrolase I FolE [Armatimonadota bacterium]